LEATLLSLQFYVVDTAICLILGYVAFRATRAGQMTTQYRWINVRRGAFGWSRRPAATTGRVEPDSG